MSRSTWRCGSDVYKKTPLETAGFLIKVGLKRFGFEMDARQPNDP